MRYLLLLFGLFCGTTAFAQISTTFSIPDLPADSNTEVCLPITVVDFTGGIEFSFALLADPGGALTFSRVTNLSPDLPGFGMDDFDLITNLASGLITVHWENWDTDAGETCEDDLSSITLDDGTILFEVCYNVVGAIATQHPVEFFNKPDSDPFDMVDDAVPVIFNKRAQCNQDNDAFPGTDDGSVTIGVSPLELTVIDDDGIYQPGDIYCVDIVADNGFDDLKGYQFGLQFDNTVLQALSATANTVLPQNTDGGYNTFGGDAFYGIWAPFGDLQETLPNGTILVTVCFEVIGECGSDTDLTIGTIPAASGGVRPVEANGSGTGLTTIPVITGSTRLVVDDCNPEGFDVIVECPSTPVNFGDTEVCIAIQAGDDFVDMTDIDYLITWDPTILEFTGVRGFEPTMFINATNDFNTDQVANGILAFEWEAFNATATVSLPEGRTNYEVCFNAIGFGGTSPITIATFLNGIQSNNEFGSFTGLNPSNCAITVNQPEGVAVNFPNSIGFSSTQDGCFDLEVDQFNGVTQFDLYVSYSSALFSFENFTTAIPGITVQLNVAGLFQLSYNGTTLNLPDGTSLGSICMRAQPTATPSDCDVLDLASFIPSSVITTESEGNSVSILTFPGESCVLFPNGFGLMASDATGFISDQVCVPISVTQFTDVTDVDFNINFHPSAMTYNSVNLDGNWLGLTNANFDLSDIGIGIINVNWTSGGGGINIIGTDIVQVFELCFDTGDDDQCTDISFSDAADPAVTTDSGAGSIVYGEGEVCLEDRLILISLTVVDASCEGADDGMIIFETAPRPNGEVIFIRVDNPVRFGNSGSIGGLLPGEQNVIIYNASSTVRIDTTVTIGVNPANAAVAMAGDDQMLSCGDNNSAVISSQGNVGETFELFYIQTDGTTRFEVEGTVANDGNIVGVVTDPGCYVLIVTSAAGCTARDTVCVLGSGQPVAEANIADTPVIIDCNNETVDLFATGSSEGANVAYKWERINGAGDVLENMGNTFSITAIRGGRYRLMVTFTDLECTSTDQLIVMDQRSLPNSILPTQANLNCDGSPVLLSIGEAEDGVDYSWAPIDMPGNIISGSNELIIGTTGTYVATLFNNANGCSRMDTIVVEPSLGLPTIDFPTQQSISCNPDTTVLQPVYANVSETTSYSWSTDNGRVVITDTDLANPRIVLSGTYTVTVSNGACEVQQEVVVSEAVLPTVEAGLGGQLLCTEDFELVGSGVSAQGNNLSFQWSFEGSDVDMGAAAAILVNTAGTYFLEVTDDSTGCVALDSVVIDIPAGLPVYMLADTVRGLGCDGDLVSLTVQSNQNGYTYLWTDPNGDAAGETAQINAGTEGIYTVIITNPETGCTIADQVEVIADQTDLPFVAFRQNNIDLTCDTGPALIDAEPSSGGLLFQYVWENVVAGEVPSEQGNDSLTVRTAGIYRLTITNLATMCVASREMEVTDSRVFPMVEAVEGITLDCDNRETTIGIDILDQPNNYGIQWSGSFAIGIDSLPRDTNRIVVTQGGTYNAVVINPVSSCVTVISISVEDLTDSIATIIIMPTDSFDCNNETITIDASETELNNATAAGIVWASLDGNVVTPATGSLIVSVNGPGAYELSVTDETGCTVRDTVNVVAALDTPFAQAGEQLEVDCDEMPQLNGNASTPLPGGNILYAWSASDGGEVLPGSETGTSTPFVSGPGTYQLVITNLSNGCADTSMTTVILGEQAAADLPANFTTCETPATVTGNQPDGTTGVWTSFNDDGTAFTVANNVATISELADVISLVWTLSKPGCVDYSADTIRVSQEESPNANNDVLQIGGNNNIGSVDLLANDQRTGPVVVNLLSEPSFGTVLSNLNGEITFEAPVGQTGTTTIDYEVCSTVCAGLCDMATLTISSDADGIDPQVYNAVTPNGDGMNETFVFDILNLRPDDFPDNEIIIFNRWNDIIYQAKPYNNEWAGTLEDGTPVPEGTYYYILRLNIGEGDIIRGDVTVIR